MTLQASDRVFNPFRGRSVDVDPDRGAILLGVQRILNCFESTAAERHALAGREFRENATRSVLGELESFDNEVAGAASWCAGAKPHPDPVAAIVRLNAYDVTTLLTRLSAYPSLLVYVWAMADLRELLVRFLTPKPDKARNHNT